MEITNFSLMREEKDGITSVKDNHGEVHTSHSGIATVAATYFQNLLGQNIPVHPLPEDLPLPAITDGQASFLEAPFTGNDVLKALKSVAKNRSPGPDGYTVEFYLATWHIIGLDVTNAVLSFFEKGHLPRMINSAAITLVPKHQNPTTMAHFRPISCCNVLYKVISKLLCCRLKTVLPSLISPN